MRPLYSEVAAIDVHKSMLAVVIMDIRGAEYACLRRKFGTSKNQVDQLAQWLREHGVHAVVMESTAQYWKGVWASLEREFVLHLAPARANAAPHGQQAEGKKLDVGWIEVARPHLHTARSKCGQDGSLLTTGWPDFLVKPICINTLKVGARNSDPSPIGHTARNAPTRDDQVVPSPWGGALILL